MVKEIKKLLFFSIFISIQLICAQYSMAAMDHLSTFTDINMTHDLEKALNEKYDKNDRSKFVPGGTLYYFYKEYIDSRKNAGVTDHQYNPGEITPEGYHIFVLDNNRTETFKEYKYGAQTLLRPIDIEFDFTNYQNKLGPPQIRYLRESEIDKDEKNYYQKIKPSALHEDKLDKLVPSPGFGSVQEIFSIVVPQETCPDLTAAEIGEKVRKAGEDAVKVEKEAAEKLAAEKAAEEKLAAEKAAEEEKAAAEAKAATDKAAAEKEAADKDGKEGRAKASDGSGDTNRDAIYKEITEILNRATENLNQVIKLLNQIIAMLAQGPGSTAGAPTGLAGVDTSSPLSQPSLDDQKKRRDELAEQNTKDLLEFSNLNKEKTELEKKVKDSDDKSKKEIEELNAQKTKTGQDQAEIDKKIEGISASNTAEKAEAVARLQEINPRLDELKQRTDSNQAAIAAADTSIKEQEANGAEIKKEWDALAAKAAKMNSDLNQFSTDTDSVTDPNNRVDILAQINRASDILALIQVEMNKIQNPTQRDLDAAKSDLARAEADFQQVGDHLELLKKK